MLKGLILIILSEGERGKILNLMYKNIMHIDFFPYHSRESHNSIKDDPKCSAVPGIPCRAGEITPSQKWQFELAGKAVKKGAVVIVVRPRRHWFCMVDSLTNEWPGGSNCMIYTPLAWGVNFTKNAIDFQNGKGAFDFVVDKIFS